MRLLLTKLGLLDKEGQCVQIKVVQGSKRPKQIIIDIARQEGEALLRRKSPLISNIIALNKSCKNRPLITPLSSSLLVFNTRPL